MLTGNGHVSVCASSHNENIFDARVRRTSLGAKSIACMLACIQSPFRGKFIKHGIRTLR